MYPEQPTSLQLYQYISDINYFVFAVLQLFPVYNITDKNVCPKLPLAQRYLHDCIVLSF